jgi:hypothetical protein
MPFYTLMSCCIITCHFILQLVMLSYHTILSYKSCDISYNEYLTRTGCEGCGESSRDKPLMSWNLKRVKLAAVDKNITVCGVCMDRFKHKKVASLVLSALETSSTLSYLFSFCTAPCPYKLYLVLQYFRCNF